MAQEGAAFEEHRAAHHLRQLLRLLAFAPELHRLSSPLPDVAAQVVETVTVCREAFDWSGARKAIITRVYVRKVALQDVALVLAIDDQIVAPGKRILREAATCCIFPFGFGREAALSPCTIGQCIVV